MNAAKKPLLLALLAMAVVSLFAGCVSPKTDSSIPWNRPADWEGRIPGMGMGNGRRGTRPRCKSGPLAGFFL